MYTSRTCIALICVLALLAGTTLCEARCSKLSLQLATDLLGDAGVVLEAIEVNIEACSDTSFEEIKQRIKRALQLPETAPDFSIYAQRVDDTAQIWMPSLSSNSRDQRTIGQLLFVKTQRFALNGVDCFADDYCTRIYNGNSNCNCAFNNVLFLVKDARSLHKFANARLSWMFGSWRFDKETQTHTNSTSLAPKM